MARLEFEFIGKDSGLSSNIKSYLQDIDKLKSAFSGISKGLGGNEVKTILDGQKIALGQVRLETAELTKAQKEYNLEQRKLRDTSKTSKGGTYSQLSRELTEMRNEAKNLGAQMILLENAGVKSGVVFNTLSNRFNEAQKQAVKLDGQIKKLDGSLGQYNRHVGNYERSQGNANGVAMEFTRIIQDAPFGMMGIGNNIQQLTANWGQYVQSTRAAAAETGKTVSTMALVRGAMSSIISPANLLSLGIAAITSAWTMYTMWSQKAAKETKEAKNELEDFKGSLTGLNHVQQQSISSYQENITKMQVLVAVTNDVNNSTKQRNKALKDLQDMYPQVFRNMNLERMGNIENSDSYKELTSSIVAAAQAKAAYTRIVKLQDDKLALSFQKQQKQQEEGELSRQEAIQKTINSQKNLLEQTKEYIKADAKAFFKDPVNSIKSLFGAGDPTGAEALIKALEGIDAQMSEIDKETAFLTNLAKGFEEANTGIQDANKTLKTTSTRTKEVFDYLQAIKDLLGDKQQALSVEGLSGQAKELQELSNSYEDFYNKLGKLQTRLNKDKNVKNRGAIQDAINEAYKTGESLENAQVLKILEKFEQERLALTQSANDKWALSNLDSREKDLANLRAYIAEYKANFIKLGGSVEDANANASRLQTEGKYKIDIEFYKPLLDDIRKGNKDIENEINKPFGEGSRRKMNNELNKRLFDLKTKLQEQKELLNKLGGDLDVDAGLKVARTKWEAEIEIHLKNDFLRDMVEMGKNAFNTLFQNLRTNVDEFGTSLNAVFFSLGETFKSLTDQINQRNQDSVMQDLMKVNEDGVVDLKGNWSEMMSDTQSKMQTISAGLAMAGNLISSITPQTSMAGQGLGGALSGVASGLAMSGGNPYVAAAMGGLGLISGILGARKRQKQEELQRQQLEEQKKANALLERMNALAYASQIIGSKTQYGIVTGVNRNEFGEITFRVQGQDLVASVDRTRNNNGR